MFYRWYVRQRKKRGLKVGKTKRGKGTKLMVLVDGRGTPLGVYVDSASPSEMKLALPTLKTIKVAGGIDTKVILVTGFESEMVIKETKGLGVHDCVHKPLDLDKLEKIVMAAFNTSS